MAVDHGFWRDNTVIRSIDFTALDCGAGQMICPECGGDGDWSKLHHEETHRPHALLGLQGNGLCLGGLSSSA